MFLTVCINIFISILVIIIIHYLLEYLKDTLTTKKTKDIVSSEIKKYQTILSELDLASSKEKCGGDDLLEFANECLLTESYTDNTIYSID